MRKKVDWSNYLMKKEVWQRKSINEESKQKVYCRVKSKNEERLIMVTDSASCLVAIATENIYEEEFLSKKSFYQGSKQWWWQQWWTRTRGRWRPSHWWCSFQEHTEHQTAEWFHQDQTFGIYIWWFLEILLTLDQFYLLPHHLTNWEPRFHTQRRNIPGSGLSYRFERWCWQSLEFHKNKVLLPTFCVHIGRFSFPSYTWQDFQSFHRYSHNLLYVDHQWCC